METEEVIYSRRGAEEIMDAFCSDERIPKEEKNYIRLALLLTGIATRAVRSKFDCEFKPESLKRLLNKNYNRLKMLRNKGQIQTEQWNLLFPRPESSKFDVTLMITLLSNVKDDNELSPPVSRCDYFPDSHDTSIEASLARIKYHRNYIAHLRNVKIDNDHFNDTWKCIQEEIKRLGGDQLNEEANLLKKKRLDRNSQEITNLKNEIEKIKKNQLEKAKETLEKWKEEATFFVSTKAAKSILISIKKHKCVAIIGSSGMGKTSTLRQVMLQMSENGYEIIPIVDPTELKLHSSLSDKMVFVVDDFCGRYAASKIEVDSWEKEAGKIGEVLNDTVKLVVACRSEIYQDKVFNRLSLKFCACNLLSEDLKYSHNELQSIANMYLKTETTNVMNYAHLYDFFPLLCKLYKNSPSSIIDDFFNNPFSVFETNIDNMYNAGNNSTFCALALCVISNNSLAEDWVNEVDDSLICPSIADVYEACKLNRHTPRSVIREDLQTLLNTFPKKEDGVYKTIHDKLFDILSYYFGKRMLTCLIKNANSKLIRERFGLIDATPANQLIIEVPPEKFRMFFDRIKKDWHKSKVIDVLMNRYMQVSHEFRELFLLHIVKTYNESDQRMLAHKCDIQSGDTVLMCCCSIGDIDWVNWCLYHEVDVNKTGKQEVLPLYVACDYGHAKIANILLVNNADVNRGIIATGATPLMIACKHGFTEIVELLLEYQVDIDICEKEYGLSALNVACDNSHVDIVKMLIVNGANINNCSTKGESSLFRACMKEDTELVGILMHSLADSTKCTTYGTTPMYVAIKKGLAKIVKLLLQNGEAVNKCFTHPENPPLHVACKNGNEEIVNILLDKGADVNKYWLEDGAQPLHAACENGFLRLVKLLLDNKADVNGHGSPIIVSPLYLACQNGHTEIAKLLIDNEADINKCRLDNGYSPLRIACDNGNSDIVKLLLQNLAKR